MSASSKKKLRKEQNTAALTAKQQQELKEAKKLKTYTLTFVVVMALVVAIVLGVTVRSPIVGAINRGTLAITVGEHEMNTVEMTYFYMDTINAYYQQVYSDNYATWGNYWVWMLGFNTDTALDKQVRDSATGQTWADYFLEEAITSAKSIYSLFDDSKVKDHHMTEDETKALNDNIKELTTMANYYGYSDVESFLRTYYCDGATLESYSTYKAIVAQANSYAKAFSDALEYTDEEIRAFEKGKFNNYSCFTYAFYKVSYEDYLPEREKGEDGKVHYTDEEIAKAKQQAKVDAELLLSKAPKTEKDFNLAIRDLPVNKGNEKAACTLNEDVFYEGINTSIADSGLQKWIGNANTKELDMKSFNIYSYTNTDEEKGTYDQDITGYYVVLLLDREDNLMNMVNMNYCYIKYPVAGYESNGNPKYNDSDKKQAKEKADKLLKEWSEGKATKETFIEMIKKNTQEKDGDPEGFLEDIYPGATQDAIDEWLFSADRKEGDTVVIEGESGCYIIYYTEKQEVTFRDYMIKQDLISEDAKEWLEDLIDKIPAVKANLSGIETDLVLDYWY